MVLAAIAPKRSTSTGAGAVSTAARSASCTVFTGAQIATGSEAVCFAGGTGAVGGTVDLEALCAAAGAIGKALAVYTADIAIVPHWAQQAAVGASVATAACADSRARNTFGTGAVAVANPIVGGGAAAFAICAPSPSAAGGTCAVFAGCGPTVKARAHTITAKPVVAGALTTVGVGCGVERARGRALSPEEARSAVGAIGEGVPPTNRIMSATVAHART